MFVLEVELEKLSQKYSKKIPRYTSYPTALELKKEFNRDDIYKRVSVSAKKINNYSLYIHLPYCPKLCYFCACNKIVTRDTQLNSEYIKFLKNELKIIALNFKTNAEAVQIHLGGGSPSYLTLVQFEQLEESIQQSFRTSTFCDKSIEIDPRMLTPEMAESLKKNKFTRASLGVQDFDPYVQKIVNRIQSYETVRDSYNCLREAGFNHINFDLIYGLPGQSIHSFSKTIEQVVKLKPDRIALYGYAHVNWKVKVQNIFSKSLMPLPIDRLKMFIKSVEILTAAGYLYIGLDHFALPGDSLSKARKQGKLKRNFMGYTTLAGQATIAAGVSAISDLEGNLYQNSLAVAEYKQHLSKFQLPIDKFYGRSTADCAKAWIIERLMCDREFSFSSLFVQFPSESDLISEILNLGIIRLKSMLEDGLIVLKFNSLRVTDIGVFFLRNIASAFDSFLSSEHSAHRYSQSV